MKRTIVAWIGLLTAILLAGCSGQAPTAPSETDRQQATQTDVASQEPDNAPGASYSHVIAVEAEYYTTGPQQGRPPDGKFPAGTKVNIVETAGSYTLVRSADGVEAYVDADAVKENETRDRQP